MACVRYTGVVIDRRSSIRYSTRYSRNYSLMHMYVISRDQYKVSTKVIYKVFLRLFHEVL